MSALHSAVIQDLEDPTGTADERGISADGDRIFFETSDPLVPQDSNTNSPAILCEEGAKLSAGARMCMSGRTVSST